ncbi:MAG TPA: hypothetical protein VFF28_02620 [Candidatus Nanoarchaeia archaeon]|nr:hypothetical protein [Candidatus Nanoarchaeia archaeon]
MKLFFIAFFLIALTQTAFAQRCAYTSDIDELSMIRDEEVPCPQTVEVWFENTRSEYSDNLTCRYTSTDGKRLSFFIAPEDELRCQPIVSVIFTRTAVLSREAARAGQQTPLIYSDSQVEQPTTTEPSQPITMFVQTIRDAVDEPLLLGGFILAVILLVIVLGLLIWRR